MHRERNHALRPDPRHGMGISSRRRQQGRRRSSKQHSHGGAVRDGQAVRTLPYGIGRLTVRTGKTIGGSSVFIPDLPGMNTEVFRSTHASRHIASVARSEKRT